jgi:hypothetical protein
VDVGAHFLLRDPEDDDSVAAREARPVVGHDGVLALTRLDLHGGNRVPPHDGVDSPPEAVMHRPEERGRGNRMPEVIVKK